MTDELENRVRAIVVEKLKVSPERVTRDARFVDDLGADSLDTVDMMLTLEERLGKSIPEKESSRMLTFGDVLDYLASKGA